MRQMLRSKPASQGICQDRVLDAGFVMGSNDEQQKLVVG